MFNPWKEMHIVNDPGSMQNMILVTRKIGERERERDETKNNVANKPKY